MDCFFSGPMQFAFETLGPSATHCQCVLQLLLTLKPCFSVSCRATGLRSDLALPKSAGITSINLDPIFRKAAFLRGFLHGKRAVSGAEPQHAPSHAASDLDASPRSLLAQGWPRASREVTAAQSVLPRGGFSVDVLRKLRLCKHAGVLFSPMS